MIPELIIPPTPQHLAARATRAAESLTRSGLAATADGTTVTITVPGEVASRLALLVHAACVATDHIVRRPDRPKEGR